MPYCMMVLIGCSDEGKGEKGGSYVNTKNFADFIKVWHLTVVVNVCSKRSYCSKKIITAVKKLLLQ